MSAAPEMTDRVPTPAPLAAGSRGQQHPTVVPLLRPVPIPATEPPFDDEIGSLGFVTPVLRYGGDSALVDGVFAMADPGAAEGAAAATWNQPVLSVRAGAAAAGVVTGSAVPSRSTATPVRTAPALRVLPGGRPTTSPLSGRDDLAELPGPVLGVVGAPPDRDDEPEVRRVAELPDPRPLAGQLAQAVVEVLAGDRPITQLLTWLDERIYTELSGLAPRPRTAPTLARSRTVLIRPQDRPKVRSIHVCRPADGVAEIAARVQVNGRSRAVALRLEEWRGRWRCNALVVG
jgi:hypothetical protein